MDRKRRARRAQKRLELSRLTAGMCVRCGKEKTSDGSRYGPACRDYFAVNMRRRVGSKPWRKGGPGRPPLNPSEAA